MGLDETGSEKPKGDADVFLLGQRVSEGVGFASDTGPPAKIPSLGHYSRLTWNFHDFSYSRNVPFRTWNIYQTLDLGRGRQDKAQIDSLLIVEGQPHHKYFVPAGHSPEARPNTTRP